MLDVSKYARFFATIVRRTIISKITSRGAPEISKESDLKFCDARVLYKLFSRLTWQEWRYARRTQAKNRAVC